MQRLVTKSLLLVFACALLVIGVFALPQAHAEDPTPEGWWGTTWETTPPGWTNPDVFAILKNPDRISAHGILYTKIDNLWVAPNGDTISIAPGQPYSLVLSLWSSLPPGTYGPPPTFLGHPWHDHNIGD